MRVKEVGLSVMAPPIIVPREVAHLFAFEERPSHKGLEMRGLDAGLAHHDLTPTLRTKSRNASKMYSLSRGPGDASEWYWMVITG